MIERLKLIALMAYGITALVILNWCERHDPDYDGLSIDRRAAQASSRSYNAGGVISVAGALLFALALMWGFLVWIGAIA